MAISTLEKFLIATGVGIGSISFSRSLPYIQNRFDFYAHKIHGLLPIAISSSKPYLIGTACLSPLNLMGVCFTSSLLMTDFPRHSVPMSILERSMHGFSYYIPGAICWTLTSSILSSSATLSSYTAINPGIPIIGSVLTAMFIGSKISDFIYKPLHNFCNATDNHVIRRTTAVEERFLDR